MTDRWPAVATVSRQDQAVWLMVAVRHDPRVTPGVLTYEQTPDGLWQLQHSAPDGMIVTFDERVLARVSEEDVIDRMMSLIDGMTADERFFVASVRPDRAEQPWLIVQRRYDITFGR